MSRAGRALFFLSLPEPAKLCCISLCLQEEDEESRSRQMKTCRELVLLYSDILASPALDSFTEITVVMATTFFRRGIIQAYGQRHNLQLGPPRCVLPGVLQCCVSYALTTRLTPSWNKAGLYLVSGRDFLTECGRLSAVSMELSTSENQLCLSVEASAVRLPPPKLEDLELPPLVLRNFYSRPDSVLHTVSAGGVVWCHVLPSMKKGQIITISRQLPRDGPFRSYTDLQSHWNRLYGYRLPDLPDAEAVYCSVYFRPVGERLFTYPLSCIRLQPVQRCARVDLQGALSSFMSDVRDRLHSVCGFPARMTGKPCYYTAGLSSAASAQVLSGDQVNLTDTPSVRPILTQLPAPAARPTKPLLGSQPPAWPPLSQQSSGGRWDSSGGAEETQGGGYGSWSSQGYRGKEERPSSSSSSCVFSSALSSSPPFAHSSLGYQSAPAHPSSRSSSSSTSSMGFPTAPSLTSSSSSAFSSLPPPGQPQAIPAPKLVPVFNNIALLRAQKQKEQLGRAGAEERGRVTLPAIVGKKRPAPSYHLSLPSPSLPSSSFSSTWPLGPQIPPPPVIPRFAARRSGSCGVDAPHPKPNHMPNFGSASRLPKPGLNLSPNPNADLKSKFSSDPNAGSRQNPASKVPEGQTPQKPSASQPPPPGPPAPSDVPGHRGGDVFESKPKKSRSAVQDVDVEKMARSNQLSKVNSATLLVWLKGRGVAVRAKDRKEELILKVMGCLVEA